MINCGMKKILLYIIISITFGACGSSSIEIKGFDSTTWKNDKNGCLNKRKQFLSQIVAQKSELIGLYETDVVKLFGSPDMHELDKKGKKSYYYYLEPSKKCGSNSERTQMLALDFNSLNTLILVTVQKW